MIGVGLAGFFVFSETNSNSRIVINPWMSPSQKLSQKRTVSNDLLTTLKKIETKTYDRVDAEMRVATYGIFTHNANSCDKEMFLKNYGRNMNGVDNYFIEEEILTNVLEKSLEYFAHIRKQGDWQSLNFFYTWTLLKKNNYLYKTKSTIDFIPEEVQLWIQH